MTEANPLLDAALSYAARGWAVVPLHTPTEEGCSCRRLDCDDVGKHPRTLHGLNDATTDADQIRRWWFMWPQANVGVRTGAGSGFVALDVDVSKGGDETLFTLTREHGPLPETVEAVTGSGGQHKLFVHPVVPVKNSVRELGEGLDVRGDGGYIVVAPSLHASGRHYAWEASSDPETTALAPLPPWLLERIRKDAPRGASTATAKGVETRGGIIVKGARNAYLFREASALRGRGFEDDEIYAALALVNENRFSPPLADQIVHDLAYRVAKTYAPNENVIQAEDEQRDADLTLQSLRAVVGANATMAAALEARSALAVVAQTDRGELEVVLNDLRAHGLRGRDLESLRKVIAEETRKQARARLHVVGNEDGLPRVKDVLPNAPVSACAVIPSRWRLTADEMVSERESHDDGDSRQSSKTIASAPIVISGRLKDVNDGSELWRLAFLRDNRWQQHTVNRGVASNARSIVELAGIGLPVHSGNAGDIVEYLAAFEAANKTALPRSHVTKQLGWQGERGLYGYLVGRTLIRPDGTHGEDFSLERTATEDWREDQIAFQGEDDGDEQMADAFTTRGTFEDWRAGIAGIAGYPRAVLALYASIAPPLLMIFEARNFIVDWSYRTSTGKTTILRVAASVWGCADESAPASVLGTWNASRVWVERASATLTGLPLILDDTKGSKNPKFVPQTIYDVVSGRGRGRGSVKGTRRTSSYQTVLLSNGEQQLTGFSEDGGTRARTLSLWGKPFGEADASTIGVVAALNATTRAHYGHAGPRVIQFLYAHRDEWDEWADEFNQMREVYTAAAGDNSVLARQAEAFALLDFAAWVAHEALDLPWCYADPIAPLWDDLALGALDADRALAALKDTYEWAVGHRQEFSSNQKGDAAVPPTSGGWVGRWVESETRYIGFIPVRIREMLKNWGYDAEAMTRQWGDNGWLLMNEGRRDFQARIDGTGVRLLAINLDKLEELGIGV